MAPSREDLEESTVCKHRRLATTGKASVLAADFTAVEKETLFCTMECPHLPGISLDLLQMSKSRVSHLSWLIEQLIIHHIKGDTIDSISGKSAPSLLFLNIITC